MKSNQIIPQAPASNEVSVRHSRPAHRTYFSKLSIALWAATWAGAVAAQASITVPNTVPNGDNYLSLWAGAYYDQQTFWERGSGDIAASVYAFDETSDGLANNGSRHRAWANGSVTANSLSLYSRSYAYVQGRNYSSWANATASARATTYFMVQGGGAPGTIGTLVVPLHVSGSVELRPGSWSQDLNNPNSSPLGYAYGDASMYFWATGLNASGCSYYVTAGCLDISQDPTNYPGGIIAIDTVVNSNNPVRTWTLHIPFNFDNVSSFSLEMWTGANSSVFTNTGGWIDHYAESDFGNTLRWGGISEVLDANGQPVTGWSIQSPGVDLRVAAIPEPETYALMLTGLGLVGWAARRRQAV
jgi:hypothetical protein